MMIKSFIKNLIIKIKEKFYIINENTEVTIVGWPDPLYNEIVDFLVRCKLKDSLAIMQAHLKEVDMSRYDLKDLDIKYYQFSVLMDNDNKKGDHLVYTLWGNGKIEVEDKYKDILKF